MKQHHSTRALSLYLSLSLFFISCGSKEPTIKVTGQDGRVFSSYQEACAAQDFTAAHQYLVVLKSTADSYHGKDGSRNYDKYLHYIDLFNEGEAYVYKNEALFLMTMDDDDFITKRLMFLLKEAGDEGNDSRCNMLVDLAIDMDKEGIVKALTKMYKNGIPASELSKITEYLYVQKGKRNLDFVKQLLQGYGSLDIRDKSMITSLAAVNEKSLSDRVVLALAEAGKYVPPMPSIDGYIKSDFYGELDQDSAHVKYNNAAKAFNAECRSVLNIAIANKNLYLAKAAVSKMKRTLDLLEVGDWVKVVEHTTNSSVYNAFRASISSEDIKAAQSELNEAIKSGAFR